MRRATHLRRLTKMGSAMLFDVSRRAVLTGGGASIALTLMPVRAVAADAMIVVTLATKGGRRAVVSHWKPKGRLVGTILFSHGANSAPRHYERLIAPWVAAGYEVFAPLHVDSAEHPDTKHYPGLASWAARLEDMRALAAHIGSRPYIAAGHSYGGLTAIALGGGVSLVPQGVEGPLRDPIAKAVLAFSPPAPVPVLTGEAGYASVNVPMLVQTGTRDVPPGLTDPEGWRGHLAPYDAAQSDGQRYALVLEDVDHYFGGLICRPDVPGPQQITQLDQAIQISRLFLDGYGRPSKNARRKLDARLAQDGAVRLARK